RRVPAVDAVVATDVADAELADVPVPVRGHVGVPELGPVGAVRDAGGRAVRTELRVATRGEVGDPDRLTRRADAEALPDALGRPLREDRGPYRLCRGSHGAAAHGGAGRGVCRRVLRAGRRQVL